jgi:outer membrane protein OmpA-like peptidoglycan-associated protein
MVRKFMLFQLFILLMQFGANAQVSPGDSLRKAKTLLEDASVRSSKKEIEVIIRNVDIGKYPEVKVVVEAYNKLGYPLDTLYAENLFILENGVEKKVISVEKLSVRERVPVDFMFMIDKTGSMQKYIDDVKRNIYNFTQSLVKRGIDYQIGLITFSDIVEKNFQFTDNVQTFTSWLNTVSATGGLDEKENALEVIEEACLRTKFRPSANKVGVLITDAPYHQEGENGEGVTDETTQSIIELMRKSEFRLFAITPPRLQNYTMMAGKTRGNAYDLDYPFSTILDNFSNQLTSVYALKYKSGQPAIPDSINIALLNEKKQELVRKIIPIVELGRKLIIENLLYKVNSSELPDTVQELEVLYEFLNNKKNVVVLIEGHTDDRGSNRINDALSLQRAESVKRYMVKKGIDVSRIKTKGYGKRKPITGNETEFGRMMNRRTEIVIVAK